MVDSVKSEQQPENGHPALKKFNFMYKVGMIYSNKELLIVSYSEFQVENQ